MPEGDQPRHMLGPHVVGQRIVVRHRLPDERGPSGGPAATDVLGTCLAWADGVCVLARADGSTVRIPTALIVSGKPVPPRPSVRSRVSAEAAERHGLALWPTVALTEVGPWLARTETAPEGRLRRRANSALAFTMPADLPGCAARVIEHYRALDRPVWLQTEPGGEVAGALAELGWVGITPSGDAHFLVGSLASALRALPAPVGDLSVSGTSAAVRHGDGYLRAALSADPSGDWVGIADLAVPPDQRRRGVASQMLATALDWAGSAGAGTVFLHAEVTNGPALALYEQIGLRVHHDCTYLTPGPG